MDEQNETFTLWGHNFHGAYSTPIALASMPGVYVIWCLSKRGWRVLDVGESVDVRERVANHERAECWEQYCRGSIRYSAFYTPGETEAVRRSAVEKIRKTAKPPCGEDSLSANSWSPESPVYKT